MQLNNESKTLFIPLLGRAQMSEKNLFLKDTKAEEIINKVDYDFTKLKQSKWLSMYMSLRGLLIDELTNKFNTKLSKKGKIINTKILNKNINNNKITLEVFVVTNEIISDTEKIE